MPRSPPGSRAFRSYGCPSKIPSDVFASFAAIPATFGWIPAPGLGSMPCFRLFPALAIQSALETHGQHKHYLYDAAVAHDSRRHELHNYRALLERIGVAGESAPYFEIVTDEICSDQIAVHIFPGGSQAALKRWPEERWIALINHLINDGYRVALTGAEADRVHAERLRTALADPSRASVAAGLTLEETARLLKTCCLVVSVDTGIMHLASALQCKLVALHGPTAPERWGPLNKDSIAVQPASDCLHCISLGFEACSRKKRCIDEISVPQMLNACTKLLRDETAATPVAAAQMSSV